MKTKQQNKKSTMMVRINKEKLQITRMKVLKEMTFLVQEEKNNTHQWEWNSL